MKKILLAILSLSLLLAVPVLAVQPSSLSWTFAPADVTTFGVTGFSVERKAETCTGNAVAFAEIAVVAATLRAYSDVAVTPGSFYCYRVLAVGSAGKSPPSNTAQKLVPFDTPGAPTGLTVN